MQDESTISQASFTYVKHVNRDISHLMRWVRGKKKNLFRKTAQYFLLTLHIREAAITP